MSRYLSGDNIDQLSTTANEDGKEWERNTDITYVLQDGPMKDISLKWRNATVRNNYANDIDENRLIVSYTLALP